MEKIIAIKPLENYILWIKFSDNKDALINLRPFIKDGISAKLLEKSYFEKVNIDELGGISWENGFDFCPNFLREISEKH
jgi:hypothetical protein